MPTSYTSLLGLALPVTGELSGTWGDTVNNYITQYLDSSVAGAQIISGSQTTVTLTPTQGASLIQAAGTTSGSSQYGIIRCTGNPASTLTITVSYSSLTNAQFSKSYLVINATSTSQSVVVRATTSSGTSSGVTLVSGESAVVAWNGTDFVKVASSTADGVTTFSAGTTGFTPSTATSGAVTLAGTLATTNGGTGLTSFTANGVVYASSSSALTTGSALVFTGTRLGIGDASPVSTLTVKSGNGDQVTLNNAGERYTQFTLQNNGTSKGALWVDNTNSLLELYGYSGMSLTFSANGSEQMRLTSTGLGIGTSSPGAKLSVVNAISAGSIGTSFQQEIVNNNGAGVGDWSGTIYRWLPNNANTNQAYIGAVITSNSGDTLSDLVFGVKNSTTGNTIVEAMRISKGNLGLGVTPSAWSAFDPVLQIKTPGGGAGAIAGSGVDNFRMFANTYYDGAYKRYGAGYATQYEQASGAHVWYTAGTSTANSTISFTQAMTLDASGNLNVGVTGVNYTLAAKRTGSKDLLYLENAGTGARIVFLDNADNSAIESSGGNLIFCTANNTTERARIDSSGNLSVGGTAARGTTVGAAAIQLFNGTAPAGTLTNGVSLYSSSGDLRFMDAAGNAYQVGFRNIPQSGSAKTTSYTLATTDVGEYIQVGSSGSVVIPDATFATGDVVSVFNNTSGTITITCSITTAYIAGTDSDKATMTLASRGVATILFISSTVCVVSGNVT